MTAPDRPAREQVDADALALIDDLFATFLIPHDDADPMHAGWTRGASVRADVAQEWRDRRAALVARTPQPADESDELHPEALERAARDLAQDVGWRWGVDPDRDARHRERATIAIRSYLRALPPAAAPLPAVPDGEDEAIADRARHLDRYYGLWVLDDKSWDEMSHEEAYKRGQVFATRYIARHDMSPADVGGEDVPARLDAAAEALEALHSGLGYELRQVADQLRDGDGGTRELRAAVAAALALPTEREK